MKCYLLLPMISSKNTIHPLNSDKKGFFFGNKVHETGKDSKICLFYNV